MLKPIILEFLKFVIKELGIKTTVSLVFSNNHDGFETFAYYDKENQKIAIYTEGRRLADICRSLAHELVHKKQFEDKKLEVPHPAYGGPIEGEANAIAGELVRKFGKTVRPDIYEL